MKTQIIAEIGANHEGSLQSAMQFVYMAAEIGVDVVKFQCHIAEAETLEDAPSPPYFNSKETRTEFFKRTAFTKEEMRQLKAYAESMDVKYLCSPFSLEAVDLLEDIGVYAYKIPSGEVTNIPLLEKIAKTDKPVYLSSGMSNLNELDKAVETLGSKKLTLMQCSSIYPCPNDKVGLNMIRELGERYHRPVGFSDHTLDNYAAFAAVALGAVAIEKHFTLTNDVRSPDASFSLTPDKFAEMIEGIRRIEETIQPIDKNDIDEYKEMRHIFTKSIVISTDIQKGTPISADMIVFKKPGDGLSPKYSKTIIGKKTKRFLRKGSTIYEQDIEW